MLSNFPQIRNEESTYSIFSRLQFALHPPNFEVMGNMLFGKKFEVGRLNFQGSFDFLCSQLPSTYTSEKFLNSHTIYPLCVPFIIKGKQIKAINYFKGDYADKMQKCLYVSEITKNRTYIRICKECIKEDLLNYGEPFYRRQHEVELNRMCSRHRIPLYEFVIFPYKIPSRYNDIYTVLNNVKEIDIPENFKTKFLDIASDISDIFTADLTNWNIEITKEKIHNKMTEKGYISVNGLTFQKEFCKAFKKYYTEEFLDYIGFNFEINDNDSWIRHTTRKKPISDPIKYLLVIKYLFGNFKNFYEYEDRHSIFNPAPYPCLNKICPNYNKLVINDCSIRISHNNPLAVFKCEHCGYTYSRRGPDKTINDIYKKTYVKDYGHLWLDNLKKFNEQGFSLRKMSKLLGCPNLDTIKRYIEKITSGNLINDEKKKTLEEENDLLLVDKYKSMFLKILNESPEMNALSAYKKNPTAYNLISKFDRNWIENNFVIKKNHICSNKNRLKKYWEDKDISLSDKINKSIAKIKTQQDLYERITISLLQKHIGYYNLHQNKSKLPKCFKLINLECETIQDYQKRRIDYVMKQMAEENKKITFAKVFRYVGLRDSAKPEVLNYVQQKINEHNQGKVIRENMQDC